MAHFYGTLQGARGEATRLGHKSTGVTTRAASWAGCVRVELWHDEETDTDWARVSLEPWHGEGRQATLYVGPVSGADTPDADPNERTLDKRLSSAALVIALGDTIRAENAARATAKGGA